MTKKFLNAWLKTFILFVGIVAYIALVVYLLAIGFYLLGALCFLAAVSLLYTWLGWEFIKG